MGRRPCCDKKEGLNRGAWTAMEDKLLTDHINLHGEGQWRNLPKVAGLKRCGKSCRLRWLNYLRPEIRRGNITADEDDLIIRLHSLLGNRWSLIAGRLPGRTDNEIKNYWNTNLSKKIIQDDLRNNEKTKLNHQRKLPQPKTTDSGSVVVVRTKAVKCTRVFLTPPKPPLPPPPPPSTQMQNPASKGFEIGDSFSLEEGLMLDDPFLMDFGVSFSEFLDSDKLMSVISSDVSFAELSQDTGDQLSSPEDPVGVFPEGMIGDWRGSGGALDGSMLENWLGV